MARSLDEKRAYFMGSINTVRSFRRVGSFPSSVSSSDPISYKAFMIVLDLCERNLLDDALAEGFTAEDFAESG